MDKNNIETEDTQEIEEVVEETVEEEVKEVKTFTQEELDNIVKSRLEREQTKAEKERKQAEELAKLSEKERAAKELEIKEQEFEDEKAVFYRERLELETSKELDKLGLPISFASYVIGEDTEETRFRIDNFKELWEKELESRRINTMKGETPTNGIKSKGISTEEFNGMSYKERLDLKTNNEEAYNKLIK